MTARPPTIAITGGSKGLGRGLVDAFLARGCNVAFCARGGTALADTERELGAQRERVLAVTADVGRYEDVARFCEAAAARFGYVDVWINNAGTSNVQSPFVELSPAEIASVVNVNLRGSMNGAHVALARMMAQGHGHLFNLEGFGSDGSTQPGMAVYGATKRAIRYFTRALAAETRGGPVKVGSLSPGVVVTDLLLDVYRRGKPENWRRQRWLFNLIGDRVDVVAPWLADRVLAGPRHGEHVAWMTIPKAVLRALNPAYHRRDLFAGKLGDGA